VCGLKPNFEEPYKIGSHTFFLYESLVILWAFGIITINNNFSWSDFFLKKKMMKLGVVIGPVKKTKD